MLAYPSHSCTFAISAWRSSAFVAAVARSACSPIWLSSSRIRPPSRLKLEAALLKRAPGEVLGFPVASGHASIMSICVAPMGRERLKAAINGQVFQAGHHHKPELDSIVQAVLLAIACLISP